MRIVITEKVVVTMQLILWNYCREFSIAVPLQRQKDKTHPRLASRA